MADGIVGANIARFLIDKYRGDLAFIVTMKINDIYLEAKSAEVPFYVFDSEKNVLDRIEGDIELGILAWWPKILKTPLLKAPRLGFINTHPSLLPHNRGKHCSFWALVEQAPFGVTLHRIDSEVDKGDIVFQAPINYDWSDTGNTLFNKAQAAMLDLFKKTYPVLRSGRFKANPQNHSIGSFHLSSEIESASKIDLNANYRARDLLNLLRARTFEGYPGCWFEEDGCRYEISIKIKKDIKNEST